VRSGLGLVIISSTLKIPATPVLMLAGHCCHPIPKQNYIYSGWIDSSFEKVPAKLCPPWIPMRLLWAKNMAQKLHLKKDGEFLLRVENATIIPINAPFASEAKSSLGLRLRVKGHVNDQNMGRLVFVTISRRLLTYLFPGSTLPQSLTLLTAPMLCVANNKQQTSGKKPWIIPSQKHGNRKMLVLK